ncbi:MAG: carbohydrate-binding protein [Deltaproteobacteria bacterium]
MDRASPGAGWWDLTERVAEVAVTSENPDYPVDSMLAGGHEWRAAETGEQTIRLTFADPQLVSHVLLRFVEKDMERTQEFTLGWAGEDEGLFRNLVRQQWTFSPQGATEEVEHYHFDLRGVRAVELTIRPGRPDATASLAEFRLA